MTQQPQARLSLLSSLGEVSSGETCVLGGVATSCPIICTPIAWSMVWGQNAEGVPEDELRARLSDRGLFLETSVDSSTTFGP